MEDDFLKQAKVKYEQMDKEEERLKEELKKVSAMKKNLKSFLASSGVIEGKKGRGRPRKKDSVPAAPASPGKKEK